MECMAAVETPETKMKDQADLDSVWNVIVHNDPVNLMSYVCLTFRRVFGFSREKAERHMLEVHNNGRSLVWSGSREQAELYVQQLHAHLLLATLEKAAQP
jgi:ATP-dependent Clp protease adaptor protein ClpS